MKDNINALLGSIRAMNTISRKYIKIGNLLIFSCAAAALFCRLSLGRLGIYDNLLCLYNELCELTGNLVSAFYVPALVIEILRLAGKYDGKWE